MSSLVRRLAREERGISLVELLLSMVLMLIVLGATLTTFTNFERDSARAANLNESQDAVRRNVGQLVRELRNLASPTATTPQAVEHAQPSDLVFRTLERPNAGVAESNVYRVRYCLDANAPARLWMQWQTSTADPAPTDATCPGAGWDGEQVVAQGVTNATRVFTYDDGDGDPSDVPEESAISSVNVELFVDMDPLRPPGGTRLRSGVFLRNQNRAPSAAFTVTKASGGKVVLNGSASSDPEGQPLKYTWWTSDGWVTKKLGTGTTCECPSDAGDYSGGSLPAGTYTVWLEVSDPGGLSTTSEPESVVIS